VSGARAAEPRRAVYTALIGGYEELNEQPVAKASIVPFICFTDDPGLRSETWDVRLVEPVLPLDPVRSARALKLTGHADLAGYDETLWVDARVTLTADPGIVLDSWLDGADVAALRHAYRVDVVSEFEEVLRLGLDDSSRLYEQLTHYATSDPDCLQAPASFTALLARRHTPSVEAAMREWLLHVLRYSRRDQLSFTHALARAGETPRLLEIDAFCSDVHIWEQPRGRSQRPAAFRVADSLRAPVSQLGELRLRVEQVTNEMLVAVAAREERIARLELQLERLRNRIAAKNKRLQALRRQVKAQ
jgi:hypothetical protein